MLLGRLTFKCMIVCIVPAVGSTTWSKTSSPVIKRRTHNSFTIRLRFFGIYTIIYHFWNSGQTTENLP